MSDEQNKPSEESSTDATTEQVAVEDQAVPQDSAVVEPPIEKASAEEPPVEEVEIDEAGVVAEEEAGEEEPAAPGKESEESVEDDSDEEEMNWYILKVQSNRERSIAEALRRKVAVEGLDEYFGAIIMPTEKVTEFKAGKKRVVERKLYPGYIVVNMVINDDTWFAVRETSGIGDFTGSGGKPTPMLPHEVARIIHEEEEEADETPKLNIRFTVDERVKIKDGTFEGFEGEVNEIDQHSGHVTVMINIFGRSTPVQLEHWQIESV